MTTVAEHPAAAAVKPKFINMQRGPVTVHDEQHRSVTVQSWPNRDWIMKQDSQAIVVVEGEFYRRFCSKAGPLQPFPEPEKAKSEITEPLRAPSGVDPQLVRDIDELLAGFDRVERAAAVGYVGARIAGATPPIRESLDAFRERLDAMARGYANVALQRSKSQAERASVVQAQEEKAVEPRKSKTTPDGMAADGSGVATGTLIESPDSTDDLDEGTETVILDRVKKAVKGSGGTTVKLRPGRSIKK